MAHKTSMKVTAYAVVLVMLCSLMSIFSPVAFAADSSTNIDGLVYLFEEKAHYEYSTSESYEATNPDNTYGNFSVVGSLSSDGTKGTIPSFLVTGSSAKLVYTYTDALLTADGESWHLVEDKTKKVDELSLVPTSIMAP